MSSSILRANNITVETDADKILQHYLAGKIDELPSGLKRKLERWEFADRQLRSGKLKRKDIADYLVRTFVDITIRTAYQDIKDAISFFGVTVDRNENEYYRGVYLEQLRVLTNLASNAGDYKSAITAIKEAAAIRGLNRQSEEIPKYAEIQPPQTIIITDPTELGIPEIQNLEQELKKLIKTKRDATYDKLAEDVESEDITDNE